LLQQVNRDTLQYAMKASAIKIDGVWQDVYKEPKTDSGKNSKRGRLSTIKDTTGIHTVRQEDVSTSAEILLEPVWKDGGLLRDTTFTEVRENAALI
jgi:nicotinamide phosphoribosyltransferase